MHHMWVFVVLLAGATVAVVALNRRGQVGVGRAPICGLCLQGSVVWLAALRLSFDVCTGDMPLHRGAQFEWRAFFTGALGVFPVTLAALLAPMAAMLFWNKTVDRAAEG